MSIVAENKGTEFILIPSGNHLARCYGMVEIGTIKETTGLYAGKEVKKVRISWETPHECHDFGNGLQPFTISQEYTLSMSEKSNLRRMLESWRGEPFNEEQIKTFDVTKLLDVPCMLSVIHKPKKSGGTKAEIAAIAKLPKTKQGTPIECPPRVNPLLELSYDNWNSAVFDSLPTYVKEKMKGAREYIKLHEAPPMESVVVDDLPF